MKAKLIEIWVQMCIDLIIRIHSSVTNCWLIIQVISLHFLAFHPTGEILFIPLTPSAAHHIFYKLCICLPFPNRSLNIVKVKKNVPSTTVLDCNGTKDYFVIVYPCFCALLSPTWQPKDLKKISLFSRASRLAVKHPPLCWKQTVSKHRYLSNFWNINQKIWSRKLLAHFFGASFTIYASQFSWWANWLDRERASKEALVRILSYF